jgi:hypothetical protein
VGSNDAEHSFWRAWVTLWCAMLLLVIAVSLLHGMDIFVAWDGYIIVICILLGILMVILQDRAVYML